jgi:TonB-linked SusC/RagA family outer membrane protein
MNASFKLESEGGISPSISTLKPIKLMENNLRRQLIMLSKRLIYAFLIQLFLCTVILANTGNAQLKSIEDVKVSLNLKERSLAVFFKQVESKTDFKFTYTDNLVDLKQPITVVENNISLYDVLVAVSIQTHLNFVQVNENIHVKSDVKNKRNSVEIAQLMEVTVSGKVTDDNGDPLPGASVTVAGTTTGTVTDIDGNYTITVPDGATLIFSYIGFEAMRVAVDNRSQIDVTLKIDAKSLEEVVVVGYGTQKKSLVTGAISSIDEKELTTISSSRVEQALQGRTSGVYVLPASGSPGSNVQVRIRGTGSNGNSEPLYIIDGMRSTTGIGYLHPSEIASIEVLKDAASSAIYGAEGANGVVIITTKTGATNGTTNITYSGQYGVQSVGRMLEMMNAKQYGAYLEEAQTPGRPTPSEVAAVQGQGTNWYKEILENAPMQNHSINFSGGTEKSSYLLGGSVFQQQGIVGGEKSKFNRYTLRLNSDHQIKPWLNLGNRLSYSNINRGAIAEDSEHSGIISNAILLDPLTPLVYTGELPAHVQQALDAGHPLIRDASGNIYGLSKFAISQSNPLSRMAITNTGTIENRIVGNIFADIEPIKGLKFTTRYGIDANFQKLHGWNPTFWFSPQVMNLGGANVFDTYTNTFTWQWENFATYQKTFNKHSFNILAGVSALNNSLYRLSGTSVGMFREEDKFAYHDFIPDVGDRVNGYEINDKLSSYYGRVSYDYENKYLFNATVRRDGSSLLPPNNRWGIFPSVSLGWVMSNESFFPSDSKLNYLKLRASWGQNGNLSNLVSGQWASTITSQNIRYTDSNGDFLIGAEPANLPNYELTWETSEQLDIGIDLGFLNDKITLTADYFNKTTKNLLTPGTPPNFIGFSLPKINGGNVKNSGIEFEISYRQLEKALKYEISLNGTAIKNEATYLNPLYPRIGGVGVGTGWTATAFEVGYPLWFFRGYKTDGIFQTQEQINEYISNNSITGYAPNPGDPIVVDVNGDGLISPNDHTFIGSPHPDFVYGGRLSLSFNGFDFLLFAQGQFGNEILMGFNRNDASTTNRPVLFYNERWTGPGSTNSMFAPSTTNSYIYNSDKMIFDGSFMRIRQLQLGYTLSDNLSSRLQIKNLRVYVSLDDYFTFTKYPGLDPEAGSNNQNSLGIDRGVYPVPRKIMGGLTFNF